MMQFPQVQFGGGTKKYQLTADGREKLEKGFVTGPKATVMWFLLSAAPCSAQMIAQHTQFDQSNVNGMLQDLKREKYITELIR